MTDNQTQSQENGLWNGFVKIEFKYKKRDVIVVFPNITPNKKWIWRTEFFDAYPYADIELVSKGYTLAYYRISDMYGCPAAVELMNDFHSFFTEKYEMQYQPVLFGFSRGGLYAYNFACKYPEKVSAIYFDAPVLDIRSWPGGLFEGKGDFKLWQDCLKSYGHKNTEEAMRYNFEERLDALKEANVPIIIVAGEKDDIVPFSENGAILKEFYEKNGITIESILIEKRKHHPHSLKNPERIVDFIVGNLSHTK